MSTTAAPTIRRDRRDVPMTAPAEAAVEGFDEALEMLLSYTGDPVARIDAVIAEHPDTPMAHNLRASLHLLGTEGSALPIARESVEAAGALADRMTERERGHLEANRAWVAGDLEKAAWAWERVLLDTPHDILALVAAHLTDFYLGDAHNLRDRVGRLLPAWSPSIPGYGYLLGMHAFGLEETGAYRAAEDSGRQAVELNRRDAWAVHAVAHVLEMEGRQHDGIRWMTERTEDWSVDNFFAVHNWWHLALYHLDLGELDRVFALYDQHIATTPESQLLDAIDATAMLWRLRLLNVDVGDRWEAVADRWAAAIDERWYAFNDFHAAMAFASAGRRDELDRVLANLGQVATSGQGTNRRMAADVGLPLAEAVVAFDEGRYGDVVDIVLPLRYTANRFGGSHAQRDLVHQTVVEAARRDGQLTLARALLRERLVRKPSSPTIRRQLAEVEAALG